jgi:hypothetical protein
MTSFSDQKCRGRVRVLMLRGRSHMVKGGATIKWWRKTNNVREKIWKLTNLILCSQESNWRPHTLFSYYALVLKRAFGGFRLSLETGWSCFHFSCFNYFCFQLSLCFKALCQTHGQKLHFSFLFPTVFEEPNRQKKAQKKNMLARSTQHFQMGNRVLILCYISSVLIEFYFPFFSPKASFLLFINRNFLMEVVESNVY